MSKVLTATDRSGSFRVYLTITTEDAKEAAKIHGTSPTASAALGRVLTGTALMAAQLKEPEHRLTVQFKGDGPAGQILACGNGEGDIKGYIADPSADLPLKGGKLDVGGLLGIGELTVIKDIGLKEPWSGTIALVSGEIAEDLTAYYYISEQQNTSIALGVKVGTDLDIIAAAGMFVQMMPGAGDEAADALEAVLGGMKPVTYFAEKAILAGAGKTEEKILSDMMDDMFGDLPEEFALDVLGYKDVRWKCDCSRDRMKQALATIGKKDLRELIEEDGQAELVCHFCGSRYLFGKGELEEIYNEIE